MRYLKQNIDQYVTVGPFIDKTDGFTVKDDLTVTNIKLIITRQTHASAATDSDEQTCTATAANDYGLAGHGHGGLYQLKIPDSDINFVGSCTLCMYYGTAYLPVFHEFMVVPANVWDSLMGTDLLDVSIVQLAGIAQSLNDLKDFADTGYDPSTHLALSDLKAILGTVLTQTGTQISAAFKKFFDVATPKGSVNSLPDALADAAGGLPVSDVGGLDLDAKIGALAFTVAGDVDVNVQSWKGTAAPDIATESDIADAVNDHISAAVSTPSPDTNTATSFKTTLTSAVDDFYNDMLLTITSGALIKQVKKVTNYDGTDKIITVGTGFTGTPADGVTFDLVHQ